jgi:hypothetical protein
LAARSPNPPVLRDMVNTHIEVIRHATIIASATMRATITMKAANWESDMSNMV